MTDKALMELRQRFSALPPPVIIYNKSHSGSRLLVRALHSQGVFLGAERNESEDALPILPIVEHCVLRFYPDYGRLWEEGGADLAALVALTEHAFSRHLAGYAGAGPWGWKLCESLYALPFFAFLFSEAKVIHMLRDGRDVAWSDHVAPESPFWRKVYFNTERVGHWHGRPLSNRAYEAESHLFNALHWLNSVEQGRAYGTMLGERYREIRYEALCADCLDTIKSLRGWLGIAGDDAALEKFAMTIHDRAIGKHRDKPRGQKEAVDRLLNPALAAFGYPVTQSGPSFTHRLRLHLKRRPTRNRT